MSFPAHERRLLTAAPRIGPAVVQRLEQVGLNSLAELRALGVDAAVERICCSLGSSAWQNRRRALQRALESQPCEQPDEAFS